MNFVPYISRSVSRVRRVRRANSLPLDPESKKSRQPTIIILNLKHIESDDSWQSWYIDAFSFGMLTCWNIDIIDVDTQILFDACCSVICDVRFCLYWGIVRGRCGALREMVQRRRSCIVGKIAIQSLRKSAVDVADMRHETSSKSWDFDLLLHVSATHFLDRVRDYWHARYHLVHWHFDSAGRNGAVFGVIVIITGGEPPACVTLLLLHPAGRETASS